MKKRALLSVYDKDGIVEFAQQLVELGWELVSSGGTARALQEAGVPVTDVAKITGVPAILGHRVVTLHPKVHGGILADRNDPEHRADLERYEIGLFDLVVGNLYPFTSNPSIEMIDIGGPTMVRAAAKNHAHVGIVVDPAEYQSVTQELLRHHNQLTDATRRRLARKAFAYTAAYDAAIVGWLSDGGTIGVLGEQVRACKYGENAWQTPAALFSAGTDDPLALDKFTVVAGTDPSYNNWAEIDRQLQTITHIAAGFEQNFGEVPGIAIGTKHGNPCGAAIGKKPLEVVRKMVTGDPRAIFGGLVMLNFPLDGESAEALLTYQSSSKRLFDGVIAPDFEDQATDLLARRGGKCRLLMNPALANLTTASLDALPRLRYVRGGFLRQPNYTFVLDFDSPDFHWAYDTSMGDNPRHKRDLVLAWAVGSTSNSNTITLVRDGQLIGNGVGQQDRVSCCELAVKRARDAGHEIEGAVAYSDSFFPFPDGPDVLLKAGARVVLATSGSVRDSDVADNFIQRGQLGWLPDSVGRGFFGH